MNRARASNLSLRGLFVAMLVAVALAFTAMWASIPARAGAGVTESTTPATAPQAVVVERSAVVDPMTLQFAANQSPRSAKPLRVRDTNAYLQLKSAMDLGSAFEGPQALAAAPLDTTAEVLISFIGLGAHESCGGCEPPDTQVAAGPNHVFEVDNVEGRIFTKNGTILSSFSLNQFMNLGPAPFASDPRVSYDTTSGRWFVTILSLDSSTVAKSHNGQFNLAVSTSSDPTQPFNVYNFPTAGSFPDQPSQGFNDDKVATGANSFSCKPNCNSGPSEGAELVVWNKADLVAGAPAVATDFFAPDPNQFTIHPVRSRSSTPTLFMVSAQNTDLTIWSLTGVPGVGGGTQVAKLDTTIANLALPPGAKQHGSGRLVDTGDARLLDAVYRDGALWASADSACVPAGDSVMRGCMRYIEVLTDNTPSVNQDFDFGGAGTYYYYPSVELDSSGNLVTSFSRSSSHEFPSAYVDARMAGDPSGALGTPVLLQRGEASYNGTRWGDYSGAGIDPADENTVWVAAEYSTFGSHSSNWGEWVAQVRVSTLAPTPTATSTPAVGVMRVSPGQLNYGTVKLGKVEKKQIKVKNVGKFPLQVTIGTLAPPLSVSGSGSYTLRKNKSRTATVFFKPMASGSVSQTLTITSDDPNNPSQGVTTSGNGQ